jgi:hypothetical protein
VQFLKTMTDHDSWLQLSTFCPLLRVLAQQFYASHVCHRYTYQASRMIRSSGQATADAAGRKSCCHTLEVGLVAPRGASVVTHPHRLSCKKRLRPTLHFEYQLPPVWRDKQLYLSEIGIKNTHTLVVLESYPTPRRPSRLSAALRPLTRRFAALTDASAPGWSLDMRSMRFSIFQENRLPERFRWQ